MKTTLAVSILCSLAVLPTLRASQPQAPPAPGRTLLQDPPVTIPMDLSTGRPMVKLTVNGRGPYDFVVDTGASFSLLDDAIASELGLEQVGVQAITSPGASQELEGRRVQADHLEVGGLRIEDAVVVTMDLVGFSGGVIQGILGRPHFSQLLITFDYPASHLVVGTGELDREDPSNMRTLTGDDIRFSATIAGSTMPMVIDTGAPGGFTLPKALESEISFHSPPEAGPTIQLVGGAHATWTGQLAGEIRLAELIYEDPHVALTTFSDDFAHMGFRVLRDLSLTLDQANGLVRLERSGSAAPIPQRAMRIGGPAPAKGSEGKPRLGVAFAMTPDGFVKQEGGLVVRYIEPDSAAADAGLRVDDVVLAIGGRPVADLLETSEIIALLRAPRPLAMNVSRGTKALHVVVE